VLHVTVVSTLIVNVEIATRIRRHLDVVFFERDPTTLPLIECNVETTLRDSGRGSSATVNAGEESGERVCSLLNYGVRGVTRMEIFWKYCCKSVQFDALRHFLRLHACSKYYNINIFILHVYYVTNRIANVWNSIITMSIIVILLAVQHWQHSNYGRKIQFVDQGTGPQWPSTSFFFFSLVLVLLLSYLPSRLFLSIIDRRQTSHTHRWQHYPQSHRDGFLIYVLIN